MAIEVDAGRYLFKSATPHDTSPIKKTYPKMVARIEKWEEQEQATMPTYQELGKWIACVYIHNVNGLMEIQPRDRFKN